VFSIGIGNEANKKLVMGAASRGFGEYAILGNRSLRKLPSTVIEMLQKAADPALINCAFKFFKGP